MVSIVVQDLSTAVGTDEFREIVAAVGKQVRRDFSPHWHTTAKLTTSGPGTAWQVVVVDDPDQADALGYHDLTPQGRPLGKVFAGPALEDGMSVSEVLSHEVLEMLCDPLVNKAAQDDQTGLFYAYEVCLAAETEIPLTDGSRPTIATLAERGLLRARLTGRDQPVVRVSLTDESSVRCTPDHRFLLSDGRWVAAAALRSGDSLPALAPTHAVDRGDVYAVPLREDASGLVAGADVSHGGDGELAPLVRLANDPAIPDHPALAGSVEHVLSVRAEEQMVGADAGPRVTAMAHLEPGGDRPVVHLVRDAVSREGSPLLADLAVAGGGHRPGPEPAAVGAVDARPEAVLERGRALVIGAPTGVHGPVVFEPTAMRRAEALGEYGPGASSDRAVHAKIVDAVQAAGTADVYDMTVPDHHNFAVGAGVFVHNCDPTQAQTYRIAGLKVSNFVLPAWFQRRGWGKLDFLGTLTEPFSLAPGGYISVNDGAGWGQLYGSKQVEARMQARQSVVGFGPREELRRR